MSKSILYGAAAALGAAVMTACSGSHKLASQIEGTWQANPTHVTTLPGNLVTMTDTWTFDMETGSSSGGTLLISSLVSLELPLSAAGLDSIAPGTGAYAVNMAGSVTLSATWDLDPHDPDDEIIVSVDPRSLAVTIDPDAVTVSGDADAVALDSISPALIAAARATVTGAATGRFFPIDRLDDVEIASSSLRFEIPSGSEKGQDVKVTLKRVDAPAK